MLKPPRSGAAMSLTNGAPARPADPRGSSQAAARSRRKGCYRPALRMGKPRLSGAKPLPRATQAPSQTRTRRYSHTRGPAAPSALLGSLVLRVLGSQGRGGAAPGGTLEGEAQGQPAAGGDANTPGAGALRAADTDREGRGCGRAGEGRGAERKGGWGTGRHLPAPGRCSESPPQLRAGVCGPGCRGSSSSL